MATNRFARWCFFCFALLFCLVYVPALTAQTKSSRDIHGSKASLPPPSAFVTDRADFECAPLDASLVLLATCLNHDEVLMRRLL